jgi:hypothetical protein
VKLVAGVGDASGAQDDRSHATEREHEATYHALYVQGRGTRRRELVACLRSGPALRVPRARSRGQGATEGTM